MHGWHFLTCSLTCTAIQGQKKWLHIRSSMLFRPRWLTSSLHPLKGSFLMHGQQDQLKFGLLGFLWPDLSIQDTHLSLRWLHSQRNYWSLGGLVSLSRHWPRVLSCILVITRPRTGSTHWAWCQLSKVMQVTCRPSPTGQGHAGHSYMPQWGLWGLQGWPSAWLTPPLP